MTQIAEFTSFPIFCLCVTFNSPADSLAHGSPVHSQVLAENNQLRKEADDLGPRAELEYWKKRLSKFNYLLDQLKSPDVKAANVNHSKIYKPKLGRIKCLIYLVI